MKDSNPTTTTTIGPTIVIRGKLRSGEDLIVKGRIDAEITSSKALLIENSGIVNADVQVESVRVSGVLAGNITAALIDITLHIRHHGRPEKMIKEHTGCGADALVKAGDGE